MGMLAQGRALIAVAALLAVILAGCGGTKRRAGLHPVSGTVTLNGQPVVGADVMFKKGDDSRSSFGRTDDKGHYELTTFQGGDGAPEGDYKISISKIEGGAGGKFVAMEDPGYNPYAGKSGPSAPPKSSLPPKFADGTTSGLTAKVVAGKNTFDFDLK